MTDQGNDDGERRRDETTAAVRSLKEEQPPEPLPVAFNAVADALDLSQPAPDARLNAAMSYALDRPLPAFSDYTDEFMLQLDAKEAELLAEAAQIDSDMDMLRARRENVMLGISMISHARRARDTGAR